ncbi:hypothetical protein DMENIID0001_151080 [Sergentomyia squamirostris]
MESSSGLKSKLKDLGPDLCVYFLENYFETEKTSLSSFHTIPTSLLRDEETYKKGLLVLNIFLQYCTPDDLNKAGSAWMTLLMKYISQEENPPSSIEMSYCILGKMIAKSDDANEFAKNIGSNYVSRLVMTIVDTPKSCQMSALRCLSACLQHYGGPCSPLQGRVERFILTLVDSDDDNLIMDAGKCLLLLQQLSGGGVHGVNHQKAWGKLQARLLGCLNGTLSAIFGDDLNTQEFSDPEANFNLPEIDQNIGPLKHTIVLIQRFKNLTNIFSIALLGPFKTTKPVQPVKILKLLSRTVEILGNSSRNNLTLEDVVIVNILPSMHESVLSLLKSLIALLRGNMVLFGRSICSILLSSLKCSAKSFSLRIATYQLFVFWCNTVNTASCVEDISDSFITAIIGDTKPFEIRVQLQINGVSGKGKGSKRLKRKLGESLEKQDAEMNESSGERHLNSEKYKLLCAEALNCLRQLIRCGSSFMKLHQMKRIYEHTMALIVQNVEIDAKKRPLYANRECRRSLFLTLKELLVSSYTITLPQSQFLIHVFSQAQHSEHWFENRRLCTEIIGDLDSNIHPQKLEFKFPPKDDILPVKPSSMDCERSEHSSDDENECGKNTAPDAMVSSSTNTDHNKDIVDCVIESKSSPNVTESAQTEEVQVITDEESTGQIPESATKFQDNILEIQSNNSNDIQDDSDEDIIFTPVSEAASSTQTVELERKRARDSPIILDEDSNDEDVQALVSYFIDDPQS